MIDFIKNMWATPYIALCLYWIPLVFSGIHNVMKLFEMYMQDRREHARSKALGQYYPGGDLAVGDIILRLLAVVVPVVNIIMTLVGFLPRFWSGFWTLVGGIWDFKLVGAIESSKDLPNSSFPKHAVLKDGDKVREL